MNKSILSRRHLRYEIQYTKSARIIKLETSLSRIHLKHTKRNTSTQDDKDHTLDGELTFGVTVVSRFILTQIKSFLTKQTELCFLSASFSLLLLQVSHTP